MATGRRHGRRLVDRAPRETGNGPGHVGPTQGPPWPCRSRPSRTSQQQAARTPPGARSAVLTRQLPRLCRLAGHGARAGRTAGGGALHAPLGRRCRPSAVRCRPADCRHGAGPGGRYRPVSWPSPGAGRRRRRRGRPRAPAPVAAPPVRSVEVAASVTSRRRCPGEGRSGGGSPRHPGGGHPAADGVRWGRGWAVEQEEAPDTVGCPGPPRSSGRGPLSGRAHPGSARRRDPRGRSPPRAARA
jgi:hypothetical protein